MAYPASQVWVDGVLVERNLSTWDEHVRGEKRIAEAENKAVSAASTKAKRTTKKK